MKNYFSKFVKLISVDNTKQGESNKLVMVMRVLEIIMIVYTIVDALFCALHGSYIVASGIFAVSLAYFVLFNLSYHVPIKAQIIGVNALGVLTIVGDFRIFGNDTRVHNLLIVLVVLAFFSQYGFYRIKTTYTLFLTALFVAIEFFGDEIDARSILPADFVLFFKVQNVIATFLCIGFLCYVYSKDSQHLEGKLIEYNNLLKKQASTDPLTGLCNRRSAIEFIESLIKKKTEEMGFCVCMCDVDFFKKVNDSYGHDIGDNVLRGIASTMIEGLPKSCLISRWGGEEFLIVFPHMNGDDAKILLDVIRTKIRKLEFKAGEKVFRITVTYGLAEYGYFGDADTIVKEADEKLYLGKENGRDQIVF